jgi:hypothetical protein
MDAVDDNRTTRRISDAVDRIARPATWEVTDKLAKLTTKVDAIGGMLGQLTAAMTTLAQTVTNRERQIAGLEGS